MTALDQDLPAREAATATLAAGLRSRAGGRAAGASAQESEEAAAADEVLWSPLEAHDPESGAATGRTLRPGVARHIVDLGKACCCACCCEPGPYNVIEVALPRPSGKCLDLAGQELDKHREENSVLVGGQDAAASQCSVRVVTRLRDSGQPVLLAPAQAQVTASSGVAEVGYAALVALCDHTARTLLGAAAIRGRRLK